MDWPIFSQEIIASLKAGKIGVIPTDTLYGVVGSALLPETVERIYHLRGRDEKKPCIVLLADINQLEQFDIEPTQAEGKFLGKYVPGKVSIVFPCLSEKWRYLHRGTETIAFRVPDFLPLRELLRETGPLVAPSANPQGLKPAETLQEAKQYFGERVNFYVEGGRLSGEPSTVVTFENGQPKMLRPGSVDIFREEL